MGRKRKHFLDDEYQLVFEFEPKKITDWSTLLHYYPRPHTDNEVLINYQYDFRVNGDKESLDKIYSKGFKIAQSIIFSIAKKKRFDMSFTSDKAHNAITSIIEKFLTDKEFYIKENFISYLYFRVEHELFYRRKVDKNVKFVPLDDINLLIEKKDFIQIL